jgi:peptidoglycan/xylan/chitin deacetylase (PgdA/CDA1 family)/tRNA A-37 threonylcarbamoyl transferase component Bud32
MRTVCLTFDHLGSALEVGRGGRVRPDWDDPGLLVGFPRILRLLEELGLPGTFFIEGWSLLHYPEHVADLLDRGHEVALHGWVHERWSGLGPAEEERLLGDGLAALEYVGVTAPGFRAPHGVLSPHSRDLLAALGFRYDSSLLADDDEPPGRIRPLAEDLVNIPFRWPMVDAWQYRLRERPLRPDELAREWLDLVAGATDDAPLVTLVIHPHVSGVAGDRYAAVESVLRTIAADPEVRVVGAGELLDAQPATPPLDAPAERWVPYLRRRGALTSSPWTWGPRTTLLGGVSCEAVRVGDLVVKRPRALLAVPGHWPADRGRILAEAAAMGRFPGLAPAVVDLDEANLVLTMAFAGGEVWRDQLMAGEVDLDVVSRAAAALREIHAADPAGIGGAERFDELRLAPYFGPLDGVEHVVGRLRASTEHLIHGDYSPKNILVRPGAELTVLDWEVACAGDPMFDLGFLLTHLVAKSVHLPAHAERLREACRVFLAGYGAVDEGWLAEVLGALLLARVDGLSPLSYLDSAARDTVRGIAKELLHAGGPLPW